MIECYKCKKSHIKPPYDIVTQFIYSHWLTEEDVKKWYGG